MAKVKCFFNKIENEITEIRGYNSMGEEVIITKNNAHKIPYIIISQNENFPKILYAGDLHVKVNTL